MNSNIDISIIIPARNEATYLPKLLQSISITQANFEGSIEIIVSNNDSSDQTVTIAKDHNCKLAYTSIRAISAVRNAGAKLATGDILLFIDADSEIHPDTLHKIWQTFQSKPCIAASCGFIYDRISLGIRFGLFLFDSLARFFHMAGGGGGLICRKVDFEAIGGFREDIIKAEDVMLIRDLIKRGKKDKRSFFLIPDCKTITSSRKFDQHGDWHLFTLIFKALKASITPGRVIDDVVKEYWYKN